jgi:hypothetical protein
MERNLDLYPDEMTDNERAILASQDVGKYLGSLNKNVIFEVIVRCLSSLCAQISPEERDVCSHELQKMFSIIGGGVFNTPEDFSKHMLEQLNLMQQGEPPSEFATLPIA